MEKREQIGFIIDPSTGTCTVHYHFRSVGKKTERGHYLWYIQSLDTWFQTKTLDEANDVSVALFQNFIELYLTGPKDIKPFLNKLQALGWTGLPQKKTIKRPGFRASNEIIAEDLVGATPQFNKELPIQLTKSFVHSQTSSFKTQAIAI